jgi:cysteine desulfurase family protein (TIGR01976 family)
MTKLDPAAIRSEFPALDLEHDRRPVAYFDGPGGTQVPARVIEAIADYYRTSNANDGGAFATSERSDATVAAAHAAVADLYGAESPDEIKFGANMTTLTFHLSRSIGATLRPGDEIIVTTLDHEANVSPWHAMAADRDLVVRTVDIHAEDCTLDLDDLDAKLSSRTRLVAIGYASNAVGTINPVAEIVRRAHHAGAWAWVDAVAYAPHGAIDVQALDADFLVTSAYKWYGPHAGAVYGKAAILEALPAYKVRPAHDRFETGTQNFEAIAGTGAAVDYLASLGDRFGGLGPGATRRDRLVAGLGAIRGHELGLHARLMSGLRAIPGLHIWGVTDLARAGAEKAPTISVTLESVTPRDAAAALGRRGIFTWDGDFYAQALIERLGLFETGGVLRLGIAHYTTGEEIDRLLAALEAIVLGRDRSLARA